MTQTALFTDALTGTARDEAEALVRKNHYTRSIPSGKSHWFSFGSAVVCFSIPANPNIGKFLLGRKCGCWELTRLWAPDGHEPNLLTRAIASAVDSFAKIENECPILVSYADPNQGHQGGIYRAASWVFTGISKETRYYIDASGQSVARRRFHSGTEKYQVKAQIEALGFTEAKRPGKHRFARGLTREARRLLKERFQP